MAIQVSYRLNETSGSTANDSSGNSYNGTFVGSPTLGVNGIDNRAVSFGSNNYISTSYSGHNSSDFTIGMTVMYLSTSDQILFASTSGFRGGLRYGNPTGTISISVNGNNSGSISNSISTNKRYTYVLTRSGNVYTLYNNSGIILLSITVSGAFSAGNLQVSGVLGALYNFSGVIDNFFIDNAAWTAIEINNYNLYLRGFY